MLDVIINLRHVITETFTVITGKVLDAAWAGWSNALLQPADKVQHYSSYSMLRYNRICWQQNCLGKAAAGGRQSAPGSGACPLPEQAERSGSQLCLHSPKQQMLMAPAEANMEAQSTCQSQKALQEQSWHGSSKHMLKPEARIPPKQCVWKQEVLVKVGSLHQWITTVHSKSQDYNSTWISINLSRQIFPYLQNWILLNVQILNIESEQIWTFN